jgi:DnaK suppressor protein
VSQQISVDFLNSQKEILTKELDKLQKQYETTKTVPDYGDSIDDNALEEETFEEETVLQMTLKNLIAETKAALAKIENGTYGTCEACGDKIETGRLEAFASVRKCVSCFAKE